MPVSGFEKFREFLWEFIVMNEIVGLSIEACGDVNRVDVAVRIRLCSRTCL